MFLGDVINGLTDEASAVETILRAGNVNLLAAMRQGAEAEGLQLSDYARGAVERYLSKASDEEWITLMGAIGRADDPGLICLKRAFEGARAA